MARENSVDPVPKPLIAVVPESAELYDRALRLAQDLGLPLVTELSDPRFEFLLVLTRQRLELREQGITIAGPVYTDFVAGKAAYRRCFGGGRKQLLARAVGLKRKVCPCVLDATAGLGRDAFVLACLGCMVCMVERSPIVAALLRHGLAQAEQDPEIGPLIRERMQLRLADSRTFMAGMREEQRPDVVYLDPMYPQRSKKALVKKEMRALRRIAGEDEDAPALLQAALKCARRRVVVKRPSYALLLQGPPPTVQIESKNTRFDVYLIN